MKKQWRDGLGVLVGLAMAWALAPAGLADDEPAEAKPSDAAAETPTIAIGAAKPPMKLINSVRLTTYNLGDLLESAPREQSAGDGAAQDGKAVGASDDRCAAAAAIIRSLDTDILALQGVPTEASLRWFRDAYLQDMGYEHLVAFDGGDGAGPGQAVLSRFPLLEAQVWPDRELLGNHPRNYGDGINPLAGQPMRFARSPLRVTVRITSAHEGGRDVDLTLFVVHHKDGQEAAYWRDAEGLGVGRLISEFHRERANAPVIVLGTLNAVPTDQLVRQYGSIGMRDVYLRRGSITPAEMMTHESRRVQDYIFVNQPMMTYVVRRGPFVVGTPVRDREAAQQGGAVPAGYASAHMPVSIDLHTRNRGDLALPEGYTP